LQECLKLLKAERETHQSKAIESQQLLDSNTKALGQLISSFESNKAKLQQVNANSQP